MVKSLLTTVNIIPHFSVCYIRYNEKFFSVCFQMIFNKLIHRH